jgi:WD40 repeat protein
MQLLTGYAKPITALAVSPDGKHLYSVAHGQQMIWVWDLARGEVEEKLRGPHTCHGLGALAVSPLGDWLVSVDNQTRAVSWRLPERVPGHTWYAHGKRRVVAIHPEGRLIATQMVRAGKTRYGFRLTDLDTRKTVSHYGHTGGISALAFSADGATLATASADRTVRLWDIESCEELLVLVHKLIPNEVAFRPDGQELAAAAGKSVFVWNVADGSLVRALTDHEGVVTGLAYSADGKSLASAGVDGVVIVRDARTHEVVGRRHLGVGRVGALAWRPDSSGLIAGGEQQIAVCGLDELHAPDQDPPRAAQCPAVQLRGHAKKVVGLAFSPDGRALASWSIPGDRIRLWDFSGGAGLAKEVSAFGPEFDRVRNVSWSPDCGRLAVTTEYPARAKVYSAATGEPVRNVKSSPNHFDLRLRFTPGGHLLLAVARRKTRLELFDAEGKDRLFSVETNDHSCHAVARAEDRNIYVGGGYDVARWVPATGAVDALFRQDTIIGGLEVTPDERLAATTGGNSALVWGLPDGEFRLELKHPLIVSGLAFVSDDRLLTACYDGSVRLWDLAGGTESWQLALGMGKIYCLAVAPDGLTFAVGVEKKNAIAVLDLPG